MGSSGMKQYCRWNWTYKQPTKDNLRRLLGIRQGHVVDLGCSWLGPHHRVARCRARWRRRQSGKMRVDALRRLVAWLATLEARDLLPRLALWSRRSREGWSRARSVLHWDGRVGKSADNCPPRLKLLTLLLLLLWLCNPGLGLLVDHHC